MTDKQIIIDGVDVSKCGHYHYGKCEIDYDEWNNEIIRYNERQNNPNCYYKQLKREKQECQQAMDNYVQLDLQRVKEYNELVDLYKAKEQECERLKQTLTEIKEICRFNCYNDNNKSFSKTNPIKNQRM